ILGDSASATITNTIIGQGDTNVSDLAMAGPVTIGGSNNLIRTTTAGGSLLSNSAVNGLLPGLLTGDPKLHALQFNGGLTPTLALAALSPAIAAALAGAAPATDQRGDSRFGIPDLGAYESPPLGATITVTTAADEIAPNTTLSLREAIGFANGTLAV